MTKKILSLKDATNWLNQDGLLIYPTDTVYGLGCRADSLNAIHELCQFKPRKSGFIILIANWQDYLDWFKTPLDLNKITSDRPTTWILEASQKVPTALCNERGEIAVRLVAHQPTKQLIENLNCPIVSTSANHPGQPTPTTPHALEALGFPVMEGETGKASPSRIIHYETMAIIRD